MSVQSEGVPRGPHAGLQSDDARLLAHADCMRAAIAAERHLRSVVNRYVHDRCLASDLVQDAYVKLLEAHTPKQPMRSAVAFASVVASRVALDWIRHRKHLDAQFSPDASPEDVADDRAPPDELVDRAWALERMSRVLSRMAPRRREVFLLCNVYGLSHAEISAKFEISQHTVEQHMTAARRQIRSAFRSL